VRFCADKDAARALELPYLTLWEVGNSPNWGFTVRERIKVVTTAKARSLLAEEASAAPKPGTLQVAKLENAILNKIRTYYHIFWGINGKQQENKTDGISPLA